MATTRNDWNSFTTKGKIENFDGINVAEPIHRIATKGVTDGISLRCFPSASIAQVKKTCLHYVSKLSGKYSDSKLGARYVHQMAQDILNQLDGIAKEVEHNEEISRSTKNLLKEWHEFFPSNLSEIGTPRAVASKIASLEAEVHFLKERLCVEVSKNNHDLKLARNEAHYQIKACTFAASRERERLADLYGKERQMFELQKNETDEMRENKLKETYAKYKRHISDLEHDFKNRIDTMEKTHELKLTQQMMENDRLKATLKSIEASHEKDIKELYNEIQKLREKIDQQTADALQGLFVQVHTSSTSGSSDVSSEVSEKESISDISDKKSGLKRQNKIKVKSMSTAQDGSKGSTSKMQKKDQVPQIRVFEGDLEALQDLMRRLKSAEEGRYRLEKKLKQHIASSNTRDSAFWALERKVATLQELNDALREAAMLKLKRSSGNRQGLSDLGNRDICYIETSDRLPVPKDSEYELVSCASDALFHSVYRS